MVSPCRDRVQVRTRGPGRSAPTRRCARTNGSHSRRTPYDEATQKQSSADARAVTFDCTTPTFWRFGIAQNITSRGWTVTVIRLAHLHMAAPSRPSVKMRPAVTASNAFGVIRGGAPWPGRQVPSAGRRAIARRYGAGRTKWSPSGSLASSSPARNSWMACSPRPSDDAIFMNCTNGPAAPMKTSSALSTDGNRNANDFP